MKPKKRINSKTGKYFKMFDLGDNGKLFREYDLNPKKVKNGFCIRTLGNIRSYA